MPLKKLKTKTMGRGDRKTAKGKRFRHSFGKSRPHKVEKSATVKSTDAKKETKVKAESKPKAKAKAKKKEE